MFPGLGAILGGIRTPVPGAAVAPPAIRNPFAPPAMPMGAPATGTAVANPFAARIAGLGGILGGSPYGANPYAGGGVAPGFNPFQLANRFRML